MDNDNNKEELFSQTYPIVKVNKDVLNKYIKEKQFDLLKSALEQFPNFISGATSVLETIKELNSSNDKSQKHFFDICNSVIESLKKEMEKDISQEQKDKYFAQIKVIVDKISEKDSENKNFILKMCVIGGAVLLAGVRIFLELGQNSSNSDDDPIIMDL